MSEFVWVFGDNCQRRGRKGQACIRGEPNAMGIRTKKAPGYRSGDFFTDMEYGNNCMMIREDVDAIIDKVTAPTNWEECYEGIVITKRENWPGTGLARMELYAPKTFQFLCEEMERLQCKIRQWAGETCPYPHDNCCTSLSRNKKGADLPIKKGKTTLIDI